MYLFDKLLKRQLVLGASILLPYCLASDIYLSHLFSRRGFSDLVAGFVAAST